MMKEETRLIHRSSDGETDRYEQPVSITRVLRQNIDAAFPRYPLATTAVRDRRFPIGSPLFCCVELAIRPALLNSIIFLFTANN